ncbi:hypothetical protein BU24DRAFT_487480 [Aaosphaeria arxii CBS 175.79]|uniref:Small ribosomal subunit protein mS35 mitochondrial conserved domain-containing protein n=1 Tax=Aaosphaeria arxii CBS 175.79 TaxID=1450172 RepID=A0A6A5Y6Q2_9PLEO|nr:uncharacterized protein BU24DRAFT_487480 [Aaosphaeria arxii CBS 175.79]KAF2020969.1 hypothetical protein BU24DRAFT_487480 [Aaosphaeria arxii CBS 175.79]
MASATRGLLACSSRRASQIIARQSTRSCQRGLSTTAPLRDEEDRPKRPAAAPPSYKNYLPKGLDKQFEKEFNETQAQQLEALSAQLKHLNLDAAEEALRNKKQAIPWSKREHSEDNDIRNFRITGSPGFWAEGEPRMGPDEDFYGDDITSHGHGELELHRELREYARLAAWELPLLSHLAKPFELPKQPFRFRYTSYLGESHPAANKVVVEFAVADLPNLTQLQKDKLIKLAGPRYNPSTDVVKMSCELFDTLPQNKRSLAETINKLIKEAKDPKDTFADVPFDFRHHKPTVRHEFPKEWIMTAERKKYLEEKRALLAKTEDERLQGGNIVDGQKIIESALPFTTPEPEPVMVSGPRGKKLR